MATLAPFAMPCSHLRPSASSHIASYLHPRQLPPLCLTSRFCYAAYFRPLESHLCLDGSAEASCFFHRHEQHARKVHFCSHGHPITAGPSSSSGSSSASSSSEPPHPLSKLQTLELYDVGLLLDDSHPFSPPYTATNNATACSYPGHLIGATLSVAPPTLRNLIVHQSPLPLNATLAYVISAWAPHLAKLSFRAHCVDASSLGRLVETLKGLEELEVGSVKTCWCRGQTGRIEGAKDLAGALAAAPALKRLTLHSSNALAVGGGIFFDVLAGNGKEHCHKSCAGNNGSASSAAPTTQLTSLEIRRCPVRGSAIARYLSSPAAASLQRLFIGGCKGVRAGHLASALSPAPCAFITSRQPLSLELDGRLLSNELLTALAHRVVFLRLHDPEDKHCEMVRKAAQAGQLAKCGEIVVIPGDDADEDQLRASWTSAVKGTRIDLTVGDEAWRSMRKDQEERAAWAQSMASAADDLAIAASGLAPLSFGPDAPPTSLAATRRDSTETARSTSSSSGGKRRRSGSDANSHRHRAPGPEQRRYRHLASIAPNSNSDISPWSVGAPAWPTQRADYVGYSSNQPDWEAWNAFDAPGGSIDVWRE